MTITADPAVGRLAVWQTEPCPAWCDYEHRDDDHPDDRDHAGQIGSVELHQIRAVDYGEQAGGWKLAQLRVYLRQPQHGTAFVHVVTDEISQANIHVDLRCEETVELVALLGQAQRLICDGVGR